MSVSGSPDDADEKVRVTVDLSLDRYKAFTDRIKDINEHRRDNDPTLTKSAVMRGLVGSWSRHDLDDPHRV